jgi:hypothetical protein
MDEAASVAQASERVVADTFLCRLHSKAQSSFLRTPTGHPSVTLGLKIPSKQA